MSVLPSPIPHPLDLAPWDLPAWAYDGLDWVVGVEWPDGDESAVWDLADAWFAAASALAGPRDDASAAADEVRRAYGGTGPVAAAFDDAWRRLAEGDDAPLALLISAGHELGVLVEECGAEIEAAKIEVWIEVGILVVELLALTVAVALTLGAATPAAAAAMTATRFAIQRIFRRLVASLGRKTIRRSIRGAAERAAKQTTRRTIALTAAREGIAEAGEEVAVDLGTQAYQNTTGRRDGIAPRSLGMSALGGLAGGAAGSLAGLGRHADSAGGRFAEGIAREVGGETLAESAASLATGNGLPGLDDVARAATSGASHGTIAQSTRALNAVHLDALAGPAMAPLLVPPAAPSDPGLATAPLSALAPGLAPGPASTPGGGSGLASALGAVDGHGPVRERAESASVSGTGSVSDPSGAVEAVSVSKGEVRGDSLASLAGDPRAIRCWRARRRRRATICIPVPSRPAPWSRPLWRRPTTMDSNLDRTTRRRR